MKDIFLNCIDFLHPFELFPNDSHKSFYGKARVFPYKDGEHSGVILRSYNTFVAAYIDGEFIRLWDGYSATSMRHINNFAAYCGMNECGKKWWESLKVC